MKKRTKFIVYCTIISLIISNTFFSYTFADSQENQCPACNSTPNAMQMYINFEVEVLGILNWVSEKKQVYWTNKSSWLFNGWALTLPNAFYKSTMNKLKNDLDSELKAVRTANITAVLLEKMALVWLNDSIWSIQILFKDESFVRDYKLLQEIDMTINDVIRDMWTLGIWKEQVSSSIRQDIVNLQYKYSKLYWWNNSLFDKLIISNNVKNRELLSFLLLLNTSMKSMLLAIGEETPALDTNIDYFEDRYSKWNIIATINDDYKNAIIDAYSCAKTSVCNESLGETLKNMINRWSFKNSIWNSMTTIKNAGKNLWEAFNWNIKNNKKKDNSSTDTDKILTDRQVELLNTVYWLKGPNLNASQKEVFKQNFEKTVKSFTPLTSAVKDGISYITGVVNNISDKNKTSKQKMEENLKEQGVDAKDLQGKGSLTFWEKVWNAGMALVMWIEQWLQPLRNWFVKIFGIWKQKQNEYINSLSDDEIQEQLSTVYRQKLTNPSTENVLWAYTMQLAVSNVILQKSKDKEFVTLGQNQDTHYFVEIWSYIHLMVENDIKDIIKNLWETCTYQCSNHGTDNCYAK